MRGVMLALEGCGARPWLGREGGVILARKQRGSESNKEEEGRGETAGPRPKVDEGGKSQHHSAIP